MIEAYENEMKEKAMHFLANWYQVPELNRESGMPEKIHRIHISHWDLDGHGCFIVSDALEHAHNGMLDRDSAPIQRTVQRPDLVEETLMKVLDELKPRYHEENGDSLMVLVTDLGPSPTVFTKLIRQGYRIQWCVMDHHQNHHNYNDFTMMNPVLRNSGAYLIDTSRCSTRTMLATVEEFAYTVDDHELNDMQFNGMTMEEILNASGDDTERTSWYERLYEFTMAVNAYDLGEWPRWRAVQEINGLGRSVQEQLAFGSAVRRSRETGTDAVREWEDSRLDAILDGQPLTSIPGMEDQLAQEFRDLNQEYDMFVKRMTDMGIPSAPLFQVNIGDKTMAFNGPDPYRVFGDITRIDETPYKHFSFISKEILEDPSYDVDILVYVDLNRRSVDLRSGTDDIDVSKIAIANGGGGHIRAAGFPLPWSEDQKNS